MKERKFIKDIPELVKEWDYHKNIRFSPNKVSVGSRKKFTWTCSACFRKWEAAPNNRYYKRSGCPFCADTVRVRSYINTVSFRNSILEKFPELCKEIDFDKLDIDISRISCGSKRKIWWVCKGCSYSWEAAVHHRTYNKRGCPQCAGKVISDKNRLSTNYPHLLEEWDYGKNRDVSPDDISYSSHTKVWWVCKTCLWSWKSAPSSRCRGRGCLSCSNKVVTDKNRLSKIYPHLLDGWDYYKNTVSPDDVSFGSHIKRWWVCKGCGRSWKAAVKNRTLGKTGCLKCSNGSFSKICNQWLDSLGVPPENREVPIKVGKIRYVADGFDPATNTVYEFLGDYWHGNPDVYDSNGRNSVNKKKFGVLFDKTEEKIKSLENHGYKVTYIWENDYRISEERHGK